MYSVIQHKLKNICGRGEIRHIVYNFLVPPWMWFWEEVLKEAAPRVPQHLSQAGGHSLKHLQGHADVVKLLPALIDILQARHHEIPTRRKGGGS